MKQTRLDSFFNIKYKKDKQLINTTDKEIINNTPNNTPKYGAINNTTSINPFKLNDRINSEIPKYLLRFDGASKGNPGIAGAGAVLYENGKEIWCISRYLGIQTNNYAECFAVILGIDEACRRKIKDLEVEGDSMLVINQLKGKWKVNNKDLKNLYLSIQQTLKQFNNITYKHIYRNNNKRADELANIGVSNNKF
jgi:ribonuclease HI